MKTYLVGGAVRDQLLGLTVDEKDWVVVGATSDEMLSLGYQQVGKDFPVFLHPETREEHALARTERKTGHGYKGFDVQANPNVTLEQDLLRRDLTINAIAQNNNGQLIDPYNGINDLNQRVLRHVSAAFIEDPLRVIRVARFHAKLHHLGFSIATETLALMKKISISGELQHLAAERIWREFEKALRQQSPHIFFKTLYQCDALATLMPELNKLFHHSDNLKDALDNIGQRTLQALHHAAQQNYPTTIRWAITCHATENLSRPKNLAARTVQKIDKRQSSTYQLCQRFKAPNEYTELALLAAQYSDYIIQANSAKPDLIVSLLDLCDAWRRPQRFEQLLLVAECLIATHPTEPLKNLASITFLRRVFDDCTNIDVKAFIDNGLQGEEISQALYNARKITVAHLKQQFS